MTRCFDDLSGAALVPEGIRTVRAGSDRAGSHRATRIVLVRHGEAVCNVTGVCGGQVGCTGLTMRGRLQVEALRNRLVGTGELVGTDVLYASLLPRAIETAEILLPALRVAPGPGGVLPEIVREGGLSELFPGEADGLTWTEFGATFELVDWDADPGQPIAPRGESWTGFVNRVACMLDTLASRHAGELVVAACHAGIIEASLLAKMPILGGLEGARLKLSTQHASLTTWEVDAGRWRLLGYNDVAHHLWPPIVG